MLKFYTVDLDYIEFLKNEEIKARGFTRVPNMYYPNRKIKFVCGVVKKINGYNYFAPITSYNKQRSENLCIPSISDESVFISSIRFNYMFPVPDECIHYFDFSTINDVLYRNLVEHEYQFLKNNEIQVFEKADNTYAKVTASRGHLNLKQNSCDFLLLEEKCKEYTNIYAFV